MRSELNKCPMVKNGSLGVLPSGCVGALPEAPQSRPLTPHSVRNLIANPWEHSRLQPMWFPIARDRDSVSETLGSLIYGWATCGGSLTS